MLAFRRITLIAIKQSRKSIRTSETSVVSFHVTSQRSNTKYFPINDDFFDLTDAQKQVKRLN